MDLLDNELLRNVNNLLNTKFIGISFKTKIQDKAAFIKAHTNILTTLPTLFPNQIIEAVNNRMCEMLDLTTFDVTQPGLSIE